MKTSLTKKDYTIGYTELTLAQCCVGINVISGKFLIGFFPIFLLPAKGLTKINANIAALFTGVMPVSTTILAFIFLNEPITTSEIIGMLLVIAAIFIGCKKYLFFNPELRKAA